jgi:hypothetical protein
VTNYGSFEEMKKGTSAIHGAMFFFLSKGHGAAPFYFSLDKTLITPPMQFLNIGNKKYVAFSFHKYNYNYKVHIHVFWSKLVL